MASIYDPLITAGDLGQTEWTALTLEHINSSNYDVLLLPGDLSYADCHQPLWDSFGRLVQPLASQRPWMVTHGNHEIERIPIIGPKAFTSYNARWRMPFDESGSQSNLYYSFDVAGVHVLMLASYTDFDSSSAQFKWLQDDLGKVDRKRTPWLLALLHAPWYNTNAAHQGEGESMREAMEELLYNARTDIVFAGHVHAYERFTRVYKNSIDPCGPIHVTIGDGGNREGLALLFITSSSPLSLFREASFGHGRLRMFNQTHARWTWNRNDDSVSTVRDEVWLESLAASPICTVSHPKLAPTSKRDEL
ncbi:Purple acid phosphatase 22 [Asimina triloba]